MFNKINKKIFIITLVVFIFVAVGAFAVFYQYFNNGITKSQMPQNQEQEISTEDKQNISNVEMQYTIGDEKDQDDKQQGGLIVCVDKCGDSICQEVEASCDNLNCICKEDIQECPQDCK